MGKGVCLTLLDALTTELTGVPKKHERIIWVCQYAVIVPMMNHAEPPPKRKSE